MRRLGRLGMAVLLTAAGVGFGVAGARGKHGIISDEGLLVAPEPRKRIGEARLRRHVARPQHQDLPIAADGLVVPAKDSKRVAAIVVRFRVIGPELEGAVIACDGVLVASEAGQHIAAVTEPNKVVWLEPQCPVDEPDPDGERDSPTDSISPAG